MLARLLLLFGHLVTVFADLNDAADRRHGVRRNFHEIHAMLAGQVERVVQRIDAQLFAIRPDDADFAGTDFAVDPDERGGRGVAWGKRATQATLSGWN